MWIMILTLTIYSTVVVEFNSQKDCEAAAKILLADNGARVAKCFKK